MTNLKKTKRRYNSKRRQAQARETRRQITEAARMLFTERGYSGATIEAIAQEAGVATETVYAVFGNKRAILVHLVNISVGGDESHCCSGQNHKPYSKKTTLGNNCICSLKIFR